MTTVEIASIKTGVRKYWAILGLQSRWWRFVDVDYFITINVRGRSEVCRKSLKVITAP